MADAKLSYNDLGDILMIGGSIRMPAVQDLVKQVSGHAINLSVNPDEAVSIGAAIQGGVIAGEGRAFSPFHLSRVFSCPSLLP